MPVNDSLTLQVQRIRKVLSCRIRHFKAGYIVEMTSSVLFSGTYLTNNGRRVYGVVGPKMGYYPSTTTSVYTIFFTLDGLELSELY